MTDMYTYTLSINNLYTSSYNLQVNQFAQQLDGGGGEGGVNREQLEMEILPIKSYMSLLQTKCTL